MLALFDGALRKLLAAARRGLNKSAHGTGGLAIGSAIMVGAPGALPAMQDIMKDGRAG